ncbi:MAG: leucine-rich repeat protein [Ruminococcus sp.]|nr:leucine-rich repeat protein [Ruminococcus sp.]
MEETIRFGLGVEKGIFVCIVLGILGIAAGFFLEINQRICTVDGECVGKYISSMFENREVVFDGMGSRKQEMQDGWNLILEEVLPPAIPVSDRFLTEIPIPEKPGVLSDAGEDRMKPVGLPDTGADKMKPETSGPPVLSESAASGNSGVEAPGWWKIPDEQEKTGIVIPEIPNEWNPAESITPVVPDEPVIPTVPEEPNIPMIPEEPAAPIVPEEPMPPTVPDESVPPIASDPVIPVDPVVPEPDTPLPDVGENPNVCFLLDAGGILIAFHPEYAEIERGCLFLPEECTGIRKGVFSGCGAGIKEIYIPNGTTYIEEGALAGLNELEWIEVEWNNPVYLGEEGVLFNGSRSLLLAFPNGRTGTYLISAGVTRIAGSAFAETSLSRLDARDCGILQFGEAVFGSCNGSGIQITVPRGTRAAYEAALAGYAVVITE